MILAQLRGAEFKEAPDFNIRWFSDEFQATPDQIILLRQAVHLKVDTDHSDSITTTAIMDLVAAAGRSTIDDYLRDLHIHGRKVLTSNRRRIKRKEAHRAHRRNPS
jgi:hypothetical protein